METTLIAQSIEQLSFIAVIFGCGYVTMYSSFCKADSIDIINSGIGWKYEM